MSACEHEAVLHVNQLGSWLQCRLCDEMLSPSRTGYHGETEEQTRELWASWGHVDPAPRP